MDEIIHLRSVTYTYPKRQAPALDAVDLDIKAGEFILVSGASGSGKSTFLRTLNGLVPHFSGGEISGELFVKGIPVLKEGPQSLSRHVGFVSQNPEAQTILEKVEPEIAFALENAAIPRAEMHKRVREVLDQLGLTPMRSRPIVTLSGGERQRVAIACALALQPEILVLDEPTSQLDPQSAADLLQLLSDLNHKFGLTIVLAEHRLERTLPYVDRLAYFEDGRLVAHESVRRTLVYLPHLPPVVELAKELNWDPIPLTVDEAKKFRPVLDPGPTKNLPPDETPALDGGNLLLQVQDLRFAYQPAKMALDGVDLQLRPGEILAVMGENGEKHFVALYCWSPPAP